MQTNTNPTSIVQRHFFKTRWIVASLVGRLKRSSCAQVVGRIGRLSFLSLGGPQLRRCRIGTCGVVCALGNSGCNIAEGWMGWCCRQGFWGLDHICSKGPRSKGLPEMDRRDVCHGSFDGLGDVVCDADAVVGVAVRMAGLGDGRLAADWVVGRDFAWNRSRGHICAFSAWLVDARGRNAHGRGMV